MEIIKFFSKIWEKKEKPAVQLVKMFIVHSSHLYRDDFDDFGDKIDKKDRATKVLLRNSLQLTEKNTL